MKSHRWDLSISLAALLVAVCPSWNPGQEAAPVAEPKAASAAGHPIAAARRQAIDNRSFHRPLDAAKIKRWIEISSRATMAEFELFLSPLTPQEAELLKKVAETTPPIVNRLHFADLRHVLKRGGLWSYQREEEQRPTRHVHTTPALEEQLYGAYDCVFASVGPPDGAPRYGDVIVRLKDSVREHGWATPFSGMHFLRAARHKDAARMQDLLTAGRALPAPPDKLSLGFDDRLHFSHYVVAEKDWHRALAYQAMITLRNLDDSEASGRVRRRVETMLEETDARKFWALYIPALEEGLTAADQAARAPLGYLEAKFADKLSIRDVTAIEVPPTRLEEVRAWPEAGPYLHLIRAKSAGVR
jgi:hypothetical protein